MSEQVAGRQWGASKGDLSWTQCHYRRSAILEAGNLLPSSTCVPADLLLCEVSSQCPACFQGFQTSVTDPFSLHSLPPRASQTPPPRCGLLLTF